MNSQIINENVSIEKNGPDEIVQVNESNAHSSFGKPKKTRAVVYQFFEWNDETNQYKCTLCEYVFDPIHPLLVIHDHFVISMFLERNIQFLNQVAPVH